MLSHKALKNNNNNNNNNESIKIEFKYYSLYIPI